MEPNEYGIEIEGVHIVTYGDGYRPTYKQKIDAELRKEKRVRLELKSFSRPTTAAGSGDLSDVPRDGPEDDRSPTEVLMDRYKAEKKWLQEREEWCFASSIFCTPEKIKAIFRSIMRERFEQKRIYRCPCGFEISSGYPCRLAAHGYLCPHLLNDMLLHDSKKLLYIQDQTQIDYRLIDAMLTFFKFCYTQVERSIRSQFATVTQEDKELENSAPFINPEYYARPKKRGAMTPQDQIRCLWDRYRFQCLQNTLEEQRLLQLETAVRTQEEVLQLFMRSMGKLGFVPNKFYPAHKLARDKKLKEFITASYAGHEDVDDVTKLLTDDDTEPRSGQAAKGVGEEPASDGDADANESS